MKSARGSFAYELPSKKSPIAKRSDDQRDVIDVAFSRELVRRVGDLLLLAAEPKRLLEIVALGPGSSGTARRPSALRHWRSRRVRGAVEAKTLRKLRVEIALARRRRAASRNAVVVVHVA